MMKKTNIVIIFYLLNNMDLDQRNDRNNYSNKGGVEKKSGFRKYLPWIVIGVLVIWTISSYNGLINKEENVKEKWATVETKYQARFDKTKVIAKIVKNGANFEYTTLVDVVKARQIKQELTDKANKLEESINKTNNVSGNTENFRSAHKGLFEAVQGINVVFERYPELQSTQLYTDFMAEYSGMENRVSKARSDYNQAVKNYNISVRGFPGSLIAKVFGFEVKEPFEAEEGTDKVNVDDIDISLGQ